MTLSHKWKCKFCGNIENNKTLSEGGLLHTYPKICFCDKCGKVTVILTTKRTNSKCKSNKNGKHRPYYSDDTFNGTGRYWYCFDCGEMLKHE